MIRSASSRKVTTIRNLPIAGMYLQCAAALAAEAPPQLRDRDHLRLDGLAGSVQDILDLAGVRPQLIQNAASVGLVGNSNTSAASRIGAGAANAIARRTTVRHFDQSCPVTFFFLFQARPCFLVCLSRVLPTAAGPIQRLGQIEAPGASSRATFRRNAMRCDEMRSDPELPKQKSWRDQQAARPRQLRRSTGWSNWVG